MVELIEYCLCNVNDEHRTRLRELDISREFTCLEHCGICCQESFLVVDGTVVREADHEQLVAAHLADGGA